MEGEIEHKRAAHAWGAAELISPRKVFASSRLMASPSPVPPYWRLVEASACWNASKIIRCFSGGMPMPVSATSKAMTEGTCFREGDPKTNPRSPT